MPSQPLMNEQFLLQNLRDLNTPITPTAMRQLCAMTILACWDRKLERGFFANIIDLCMQIEIDLANMEKGGALRYCLGMLDEGRDPELIDAELDRIVRGFMAKRRSLATKFELVTHCPTPADKIS